MTTRAPWYSWSRPRFRTMPTPPPRPFPALPRTRLARWAGLIGIGVITAIGASELRWALADSDEKLSIEGVSNFGRVNVRLYRGAQPTQAGFVALAKLGVNMVVKFSQGEEGAPAERAAVESLGMQFLDLPWSSAHPPPPDRLLRFLTLLRDHPAMVVFAHCKAGSDRTGVMIAASRIVFDHWTAARAIEEMNAFHYHYTFLPHLQTYVEALPGRLRTDPTLQGFTEASNDH
jgi:tyrosine-protein phosphatase SIW14